MLLLLLSFSFSTVCLFIFFPEEFFPDFRIEADSAYFVRACHNLSDDEKEDVRREFAQVLTDEGVCQARQSKVCDMRNVGIVCGRVRRKRGTEEEEVEVADISFDVFALKVEEKPVDCDKICRMIGIPQRFCDRSCVPAYKRYLKAGVIHAKNQVEALYRNSKERLTFTAAQRTFEANSAQVSDVIIDCEPGMVAEESMCGKRTFQSQQSDNCGDQNFMKAFKKAWHVSMVIFFVLSANSFSSRIK